MFLFYFADPAIKVMNTDWTFNNKIECKIVMPVCIYVLAAFRNGN